MGTALLSGFFLDAVKKISGYIDTLLDSVENMTEARKQANNTSDTREKAVVKNDKAGFSARKKLCSAQPLKRTIFEAASTQRRTLTQPIMHLRQTLKSFSFCLLLNLVLLPACDRPEPPAPSGPVFKATIDGVAWQATEAALKINTFNGMTYLEGLRIEGNTIKSNIYIAFFDEIRVGDYPGQVYPVYYENDYRNSWSTQDEYSFTITRYEQQRVWGRFRFTAYSSQADTTQLAVRQITEGVFENVPVVEIK